MQILGILPSHWRPDYTNALPFDTMFILHFTTKSYTCTDIYLGIVGRIVDDDWPHGKYRCQTEVILYPVSPSTMSMTQAVGFSRYQIELVPNVWWMNEEMFTAEIDVHVQCHCLQISTNWILPFAEVMAIKGRRFFAVAFQGLESFF